ncbi:glycosyltransferase family 4 protein [Hahella chejuensis]|uniref:glycosyltransferase family 4 protein n=1 Tax=Hahella chejuensis TaxID=158327 RepID=UPI0019308FC2|nr:glycosyltransferase family 4 protein [Hahella chejuensis]
MLKEASRYFDIDLFSLVQKFPVEENFGSLEKGLEICRKELSKYTSSIEFFPINAEKKGPNKALTAIKAGLSLSPYIEYWLSSDELSTRLLEVGSGGKYALVHCDTVGIARYASKLVSAKKILNHHNIESHMQYRRAKGESNIAKKLYFLLDAMKISYLEKRYCHEFDLNIVCSDLDGERLSKRLHVNTHVVPNGVDTEYFVSSDGESEVKDSLIFAGGMTWYPNYQAMEFFIKEVWPILKVKRPTASITIVGRGGEKLRPVVGADSTISLTGFVDDVRPYIERASVYICPIFVGGGTKLKVLDALSMSKAMVAHPIACEGIEVEQGKNVELAQTPEAMADKILYLLDNPEVRGRLGRAGRELIENCYSFRAVGDDMAERYIGLLGERG